MNASLQNQNPLDSAWLATEQSCVERLLAAWPPQAWNARGVEDHAMALASTARHNQHAGPNAIVQGLLQEYRLNTQEGLALMCMAEALLRIPDAHTRDALIRDCLQQGNWRDHLGHSPSWFVNVGTFGLALGQALQRLHIAGGMSLVRLASQSAMALLGNQFVLGQTIEEALGASQTSIKKGYTHSFDMLGEAALTHEDAQRYQQAYAHAIEVVGASSTEGTVYKRPGISVKLSALHPRYCENQRSRVMDELFPTLLALALKAQANNMAMHIDAEESERLRLAMDLTEALCTRPELRSWQGLGVVIQAYQKRAHAVVQWAIALARQTGRVLMVRLVKGAYWDSEIKRAQTLALPDYPVFTRKAHTDLSYLACAHELLRNTDCVYPQFATHNAHTVAAVLHMAQLQHIGPNQYEFQCLHGMGEGLYDGLIAEGKSSGKNHACRIYAPVGPHQHLLAYLVRRLLENGANNSFVNQLNNPDTPLKQAVADPLTQILAQGRSPGQPHPKLPAPHQLHLAHRQTAVGLNLACRRVQQTIDQALHNKQPKPCPPNTQTDAQHAIEVAFQAVADWRAQSPARRAECLERAAHLLQQNMLEFTALLVHEAKKTRANAVAEVMEAIDFLYFYAAQVRNTFHNSTHHPLGVVVCISPWNFPLAIFLGQVSAALAAGNTVVAKPAEQTPRVAKRAVELLWQAGIAPQVLQVLHGEGNTVGTALVAHKLVSGVLFTGSVKTAEVIRNNIATHPAPDGQPVRLVAETGGQNAMVVDSSALLEQVVQDVLVSAFDSAGQRCSALRILVVQDDIAQPLLHMLKGAMQALQLGKPEDLQTDVGPLVDQAAATRVQLYIHQMRSRGLPVFQCPAHQEQAQRVANAVAPTLIEIGTPKGLEQEVFGPVLHVLRCKRTAMDGALADIRELGYALTFGIHSRIKQHIDHWLANNNAGNVYVNRNMVGAMVGVQPFGGHGLSGTGPKSGGPLTLLAMLRNAPSDAIQRQLNAMGAQAMDGLEPAYVLPGPTGEHNTYQLKSKRPTPHSVNLDQAQQDWSDFEEQTVSINTAASGGNPSLLAVDDDC